MFDGFTGVSDLYRLKETGELNKLKALYSSIDLTYDAQSVTDYLITGKTHVYFFRIPECFGVMVDQLAFYAGTETSLEIMDQ